ncbi:hypothetical protein OEZ85_002829 [Tetradesmus obliquus]|uniref:Nudix hydrolase domain-containing protein n=1 Tax=Tetradesmus obliquus TaxID=3088 RepID=A0ABY8TYR2_TETOB|nr:hypothetical protein OEZ85_002829 [Tetradesmus obliquus]
MAEQRVGVGIGVIVRRGDQILLGQRHGSLGEGEWALPGGHLEHGESFEQCAAREVLEETGITISDVHFAAAENVVFPTGQHYVVIFMQGKAAEDAEAVVVEPEKCKGWRWLAFSWAPRSPRYFILAFERSQAIVHGVLQTQLGVAPAEPAPGLVGRGLSFASCRAPHDEHSSSSCCCFWPPSWPHADWRGPRWQ